jgi:hypothetical protein
MKVALPLLMVLSAVAAADEDAFSLPAVEGCPCDAVVLMLQDGLLPEKPWDGLSDSQREEFWTLGFRGVMVQRAAWAGYVICGAPGSAGRLLEFARSLSGPRQIPDASPVAQLLGLVPVSRCGPVVILFTDCCESHWPPDSLPLRMSNWLSAGVDTLVSSGDWGTSVFVFTVPGIGETCGTASWNGTGYQPLPLSSGSATVAVAPVLGGTPSDLGCISLESSGDSSMTDPWRTVMETMDAVVRELAPPVYPGDNLVWLRGSGDGPPVPLWTSTPSPPPPASARDRIEMPDLSGDPWNPAPPVGMSHPGVTSTPFPGAASGEVMAMIAAGMLERMIARDRSMLPADVSCFEVEPSADGTMILYLGWIGDVGSGYSVMSDVVEELAPLILSIQNPVVVHNSTVRASVRLGRVLAVPGEYGLSRELGTILGVI